MLEHRKADIHELYADLTQANVSAWQQWAIAGRRDNGHNLFVGDPLAAKGTRLRLSTRGRYLAQVWRHARLGDIRVAAASNDPGVKPLAFLRADGRVSIVAIVDASKALSLRGLPPGAYDVEMTDEASLRHGERLTVGPEGQARVSATSPGVIAIFPALD